MDGEVADGDHPDRPALIDHRDPADGALPHQLNCVLGRILRGDGDEVLTADLPERAVVAERERRLAALPALIAEARELAEKCEQTVTSIEAEGPLSDWGGYVKGYQRDAALARENVRALEAELAALA